MPRVKTSSFNCQPDHSLLRFLCPPPPTFASPFNIPFVVNHFCFVARLLWLPYMVSMVTEGKCVRECDQLMRTEPGVTHFPGTRGVPAVCTMNQTLLWCLESRLRLAKNRKLWLVDTKTLDVHTPSLRFPSWNPRISKADRFAADALIV